MIIENLQMCLLILLSDIICNHKNKNLFVVIIKLMEFYVYDGMNINLTNYGVINDKC